MRYDLSNDAEQPPEPLLPGLSEVALDRVRRWVFILAIASIIGFWVWWFIGFYANLLWFDQVGYAKVFTRIFLAKTLLFALGMSLGITFIGLNLYLVLNLAMGPIVRLLPMDFVRLLLALLRVAIVLAMLLGSLLLGLYAVRGWEPALLLFNRELFGVADAQFGWDVSFYVVDLALLRLAWGWCLILFATALVSSLAVYGVIFYIRGVGFVATPRTLRHLSGLGVFLMLVIAVGHVVSIFELPLSQGGVVVAGATYTDVHARIPAYWFLAGIAVIAAVGFGVSNYYGGLRLMAGAFSLWILAFLVAGLVYPFIFQRLQVAPNEFAREEPYIRRNLEATRAAYGLAAIAESPYSAAESLTAAAAREHRGAFDAIRLWDGGPLRDAYNQLQFMELYYNFINMDADRYLVDGQLRHVLVGARELNPAELPEDARNWVNQHLQYTHGYGVAMTPATGYTPGEGRPEFLIRDIPIRGSLSVARPEVYYGEAPIDFAIVNSGMREVNPNPDFAGYDGAGGVPLNSLLRRVIYALEFRDVNILLSGQVRPESRIQYRRQVSERVKAIAPFLKTDPDPYPVVDDQGKLWWIQDTYTITGRYPYSTRSEEGFSYIRNSVKAVVDAYNGDVALYVIDPADPMLRMYRRAFPELFEDFEQMPADLQRHIRYPITLFSAQAQLYLRYHVTDPQLFFNQAEQWDVPSETRFGKPGVRVTPTYLIMRLPGEDREEFVLLMPFSPAGQKKNLVGWLAARNDLPHYGQLLSFQLPDDRQVDGPSQVEARIENDQEFSQQFTLWSGAGSQIIRGQLLAIPMADTIVYVEPLYLQSRGLTFPELKKVILADNTNLVMADSMTEGLARLVGDGAAAAPSPAAAPSEPANAGQLEQIQTAISQLEEELQDLEKSLENLRKTLRGATQ